MPVPNSFANVTTSIPLSQLDANFNTPITLGNTAIQLGNTVTTLNNMTLANVTVTSGNVTISSGNVTVTNATITNANITDANVSNSAIISVNTSGNALRITQTGSGNALLVEDSANPDSTPFLIDASGKTLVGLTTARTTAIGSAAVQIAGGTAPLSFIREADSSTPINLEFAKARASGAILASGDTIGRLYFSGSDGSGQIPAAYIDSAVDGTPGTNDMPGRLVFSTTADGASSPTERMRIDSSGNVGIGQTPTGYGSTVRTVEAYIAGAAGYTLVSAASASVKTEIAAGEANLIGQVGTRTNHPLAIKTNDVERARFTSGGTLQLNTTSASEADFKLVSKADRSAHFGDSYDGGSYGCVQISRPASQGTAFHLSLIRVGNAIAGLGFANNSNTFVIANAASNAGNGMTLAVGGTSWGTQSDERKKNILGNIENAIDKVSSLRTVFFAYKNDETQKRRVGFIAQDVQAVLPEAVHVEDDEDGTLNLQYSDTIPLLVAAIKELKAELDATKAEVALLKGAA
jgi:hypothetical protein